MERIGKGKKDHDGEGRENVNKNNFVWKTKKKKTEETKKQE